MAQREDEEEEESFEVIVTHNIIKDNFSKIYVYGCFV